MRKGKVVDKRPITENGEILLNALLASECLSGLQSEEVAEKWVPMRVLYDKFTEAWVRGVIKRLREQGFVVTEWGDGARGKPVVGKPAIAKITQAGLDVLNEVSKRKNQGEV